MENYPSNSHKTRMARDQKIDLNVENYPSNSHKTKMARDEKAEPKKVEKVVTGEVVRRKKPLGKRLVETFLVDGDVKGVLGDVMHDVVIPAAKDMAADAVSQGVERMLYGEARSTSRPKELGKDADPAERARTATYLILRHQAAVTELSRLRREALDEMVAQGMTHEQIGAVLGMTRAQVRQLLNDGNDKRRGRPRKTTTAHGDTNSGRTSPSRGEDG